MFQKISPYIRSITLAAIVVVAAFFCGIKLLQTQIVDGEKYLKMTHETNVVDQEIDAVRGQIVDCNGKVLNTSKITYNVNLQDSFLEYGTQNTIIYRVLTVLRKNGEKWNDSLPITKTQPYSFVSGKESEVAEMKQRLNVGSYATVDNCIFQLYKTYKIDDKYDEQMKRYIAGVRYEMDRMDFSARNEFVLASGISEGAVLELKELSSLLTGIDITESWEREYLDGTIAPHLRGTMGSISEEQYNGLKDKGYNLNDIIGRDGVEYALESELRGIRGVRSITRNADGMAIKDEVTTQPKAGNSVMLTIDSDLQKLVQDALKYHIDYTNTDSCKSIYGVDGATAGACVVLDCKTGGVLAAASYPTFNLVDEAKDYVGVLNREGAPLLNRALFGEYRPGSTFKTITATAGLAEGVITPEARINCGGVYTYFAPSYLPTCLGWHGNLDVRGGLRYSCNIYFYETARRMGITNLAKWAGRYGIGKDLGFDLPMTTGQMSSLELYEDLGLTWNEGDVVQAGIGQCETAVSPMHLAVVAMTIANKGVRYEPHIVKSVYDYNFTEKKYDKETVIAEDFSGEPDMDVYMENIREGMKLVSADSYVSISGVGYVNSNDYIGVGHENVAIKTGSPQSAPKVFNSAVVGFYPADNPEIAFAVMTEKGTMAKILGTNIINAYANGTISTHYNDDNKPVSIL
ncbi:MAG: hypothetical protein K2N06_09970 [Oscillospiraceae bacterium]|nr:hypothetical protein [Oscillospiraceae bacterium]